MKSHVKSILPAPVFSRLRNLRFRVAGFTQNARAAGKLLRTGRSCPLGVSQFGDFAVAYRVGTSDESVIAHSFDNDIFLKSVPEYIPMSDHVILDVGAHIGTFTLIVGSKVKDGKVYAIEASSETFNFLRINVALNGLKNVVASHVCLADRVGRTILYHDLVGGNWGHTITKRLSHIGEEVQTETLRGYLERGGIERVDFAKFNCEGAEFPILIASSRDTLSKIRSMLILYHCDLVSDYSLDDLIQHLRESGFNTRVFNQSMERGWIFARQ